MKIEMRKGNKKSLSPLLSFLTVQAIRATGKSPQSSSSLLQKKPKRIV